MPITLAQAQALSQSKLTNYVIDEFRKATCRAVWVGHRAGHHCYGWIASDHEGCVHIIRRYGLSSD